MRRCRTDFPIDGLWARRCSFSKGKLLPDSYRLMVMNFFHLVQSEQPFCPLWKVMVECVCLVLWFLILSLGLHNVLCTEVPSCGKFRVFIFWLVHVLWLYAGFATISWLIYNCCRRNCCCSYGGWVLLGPGWFLSTMPLVWLSHALFKGSFLLRRPRTWSFILPNTHGAMVAFSPPSTMRGV
jgi:hypothetical protein